MAYTVRDLSNAQKFEYKGYEDFIHCIEAVSYTHLDVYKRQ